MQEAKVWQMIGGGLTAAACVGGAIMVFDIGVRPQSLVALATDLALGFLFLAGVVGIAAGRVICFLGGSSIGGEAKWWSRLAALLCLAGLVTLGIAWMRSNLNPTLSQILLGFVASCALLIGIVLSAGSRIMAAATRRPSGPG